MADLLAWATSELSPAQVRQRFASARRSGFAAWLWPEIEVANWRRATEQIVRIARNVLLAESRPRLVAHDAKAMCIAAYTSGMGPVLGYWIEKAIISADEEISEVLQLQLAHNRQRMAQLSKVAEQIVHALVTSGITPVLLKGMHTAFRYFPEIGTRPLSDIDLFVPADSMRDAEQILSQLHYQRVLRTRSPYACDWVDVSKAREPKTLAFVHKDDPWSIDILGSLDKRLPTGATIGFDRLLALTSSADLCGGVRVMREPLLALYLAVHVSQTLLNATVLRVLELALVIRRDTTDGTLDWAEFLHGAAVVGGARLVFPALTYVQQLAPGTIPQRILERCAADAADRLRKTIAGLPLYAAQPLDRHSLSERFMWVTSWHECAKQVASEFSLNSSGKPLGAACYSIGTKLWALRRRRYSA